VRKTDLNVTWSFSPQQHQRPPGILGDLSWRGTLGITEHVSTDSIATLLSWIPGYLTLSRNVSDSLIPYSQCSYRQDITWDPESLSQYRADISIEPSVRKLNDSREQGVEGSFGVERHFDPWLVRLDMPVRWLEYAASRGGLFNFTVRDVSLELTEKYLFLWDLHLYLKEVGGWARKNGPLLAQEGNYGQLRPGVNWQPATAGWADASYSLTYVGIPGDLDFRMARGFGAGLTHSIDISIDIKIGAHFNASASYRGELRKPAGQESYDKALHVVSLEVKAFL
jgi:hypothetical protein